MKQKRIWLLCTVFASAFLIYFWLSSKSRITAESYALISNGMTLEEVQRVLRAVPGDYRGNRSEEIEPNPERKDWFGDTVGIGVYFSPDGKVGGKVIFYQIEKKSWFEKVRKWFTGDTLIEYTLGLSSLNGSAV